MTTRSHFFLSALLGALLLRSLYGHSELSGFVMTGLVVTWLTHVFDVALDSIRCYRLKRIAILIYLLAMACTAPFTDFNKTSWGWAEYFLMPLAVGVLVLIPIHRGAPINDSGELPEV